MNKNKDFEAYATNLLGDDYGKKKSSGVEPTPWTKNKEKEYHPPPVDVVVVVDNKKHKNAPLNKLREKKAYDFKTIGNVKDEMRSLNDGRLTPVVVDMQNSPVEDEGPKSSFWKRRRSSKKKLIASKGDESALLIHMDDLGKENKANSDEKRIGQNPETKSRNEDTGKKRVRSNKGILLPEREDSGISLNESEEGTSALSGETTTPKAYVFKKHLNEKRDDSESDNDLAHFCVEHLKMCQSRAARELRNEIHAGHQSQLVSSLHLKNSKPDKNVHKGKVRFSIAANGTGSKNLRNTVDKDQKTNYGDSPSDRASSLENRCWSRASPTPIAFAGWKSLYTEKLQKLNTYSGIILEDRENLKKELHERKAEIEEQMMDRMEDAIAHLLKLKNTGLEQLEDLHRENIGRLALDSARFHKICNETKDVAQTLQVDDDFDDFQEYKQIIKNASKRAIIFQAIMWKIYKCSQNVEYEFKINEKVEAIFHQEDVAHVQTKIGIPRLPPFLSTRKNDDDNGEDDDSAVDSDFTSLKDLEGVPKVDGTQSTCLHQCCFTGCTNILSESVLLADWSNGLLKLINKHGLVSDTLNFGQSPWDVVQNYTGQAAVTVPKLQTVFFVEAEPHLRVVGRFSTRCQCFGVCKLGDNYAITCDPWSRFPSVRLFNELGHTLLIVQTDSIGEVLFKCPLYICSDFFNTVMYVSDATADCVYAISLNGEIIFCYENKDLEYPAGLACDRNNSVYVCGKASSNIHKITNTGTLEEKFLQKRHGVISPCAISFHPDGDHVILTDLDGKMATGFWKMLHGIT